MSSSAKPCGTCPYRRSTPVGVWHKSEYERLRAREGEQFGSAFGCHLNDGTICRGFAADQVRRGVPSIALRIKAIKEKAVADILRKVDTNDPDLYESIEEMCAANEGQPFPEKSAKARKLAAMKGRK